MESSKGVKWKGSVQNYLKNLLRNLVFAREDLLVGKDIRRKRSYFTLMERGKLRHISAPQFAERIIQKSLSQNVLIPAITPSLTPGCAANIKGRGTDYCLIRLKDQLAKCYRKWHGEGYILLIDFSDYFGSIDHDVAKKMIDKYLSDERVKQLLYLQIDGDGEVGLGLGSEPNQALAVVLPSAVDHLGERYRGVVYNGRYMDDSYFIAENKQTLHSLLEEIYPLCSSLGISINEKKTQIVKLSHGFTFLKKRFRYSKSGKIIVTPSRSAIGRERRKLKKQARMVREGTMSFDQAKTSYMSFRGSLEHKKGDGVRRFRMNTRRTVSSLDKLFYNLFGEYPKEKKRKDKHVSARY